ncbi:24-dehydrocholesterol reductase [Verticillium dahliae VdLs.17]|uniref:Delta(24)-sterol reductase n=1 Tax=Verticillium dahliae (strain VdLs.17 / ATCC MYA-4575 / FGSC 10137) TaxID=498257 RepID=G2XIW7_VERDV|nr:24-dehydrocholesterol reductase [Verticillium dahliae VdLs.17]EGY20461.1 24-dehydrocholesterol reductase [Verticillium dahliae VdLs.17]
MERHKQAVTRIASSVRAFFDRKEPYRIFHGSTNSTRPFRRDRFVDISALNNVLEVNKARRIALVEPNVPMDRLVENTLRHGLIPPVVMESPGITAGGGYAGTAGESSSFKHGFFDDTINEVEMVLANGDVVKASPTERADLFRGAAGAVGTLGITTLIELQLIEAKKYVKTTYHRTRTVAEAVELVKAETLNPENDYVDGVVFSKSHGVVVTGTLTDDKPAETKPQTFSGAWDPWYYLHVEERTKAAGTTDVSVPAVDFIPLAEYLFRYDRGGFWVGAAAFDYFRPVPFNRFFRWFLDDFLHTRMLYRALHGSGESARFMVQDLALPYENAEKFIDYTTEHTGIWPLWLCPLQQTPAPTFHPHTDRPAPAAASASTSASAAAPPAAPGAAPPQPKGRPMLNIGLWGFGAKEPAAFVAQNRALEDKLHALGGMKWLYAHLYQSRDDFWRTYDAAWYDALRAKYGADTLPTVYDKVKVDVNARAEELKQWRQRLKATWPLAGLWGIWKSIQSKDYKLHRNAEWKFNKERDA